MHAQAKGFVAVPLPTLIPRDLSGHCSRNFAVLRFLALQLVYPRSPPCLPPSLSTKSLVQHFLTPTFWNLGLDSDDWQEEVAAVTGEEGGEEAPATRPPRGGARGRVGRGVIPENEEEERRSSVYSG